MRGERIGGLVAAVVDRADHDRPVLRLHVTDDAALGRLAGLLGDPHATNEETA